MSAEKVMSHWQALNVQGAAPHDSLQLILRRRQKKEYLKLQCTVQHFHAERQDAEKTSKRRGQGGCV